MEKTESIFSSHFLFLLAVVFIIRLSVALFIPTEPVSDCSWYHETAAAISNGEGFAHNGAATAYRPPGYSFMLGFIYSLFGSNPLLGRLLNAVLGTLSILLLGLIIRKFTKEWIEVLWIAALYPEHILFTNILSSEMLFLCTFLLWFFSVQKEKAAVSGIAAAAMIYVRSVALFMPLLPILWDRKNWCKHLTTFAIAIILLAPWMVRNYQKIGSPSIATNFWVNLWLGNGSQASGAYFDTEDPPVDSEIEREKWFRKKFFEDISENPAKPISILPVKFAFFSLPAITASYWGLAGIASTKIIRIAAIVLSAINVFVFLFFILALIRRKIPPAMLWTIIYFTAIALVFFGADRFRFPISFFIIFVSVDFASRIKSKSK